MLHDRLSCGSLNAIDSDTWSKNKSMMCAARTATDTDSFATKGKKCLTRALLETEWRVFGNSED